MSYITHDVPLRMCAVGDSRTQNSAGYGQWADTVCKTLGWKRVGIADAAIAGTLLTNIDATINNLNDHWVHRAYNYRANIYVIFDGVNDTLHTGPGNTLLTRKVYGEQLGQLIENLITAPQRPSVYVLGFTPLWGNALNFAYPLGSSWPDCWAQMDDETHKQCDLKGATFVPLCSNGAVGSTVFNTAVMPAYMFVPDGIHPAPAGMNYIASQVYTYAAEQIYR